MPEPVSQFSVCPTGSTRSACVTTIGLSNSFNPKCLCHISRAVQQFQFNIMCLNLCHNSRSVQQFQPEVPVLQLSGCSTVSIQHIMPEHVSQLSVCPKVSTRSACVTTIGLSNSFNPKCLCHNYRSVQHFQPEVPVSQPSICPTVSTRSACVTTFGLSNSFISTYFA